MTTSETEQNLDQQELILTRQRDEALELAKNSPTRAHLKSLKVAESALNDFRSERYNSTPGQYFDNLMDVVTFLESDGWKISKTTLYEHKEAGKIRKGINGKYSLTDVQEYARQYLQRKDGSQVDDKTNFQEQKLREEIRRISSDAAMRELKLQERRGELIPLEEVEVELAARVGDLKTHLDASARSSAGRIIKLVCGDPQKSAELISFMLGINRKMMDNYSRPIAGPEEE
jgi:hypothetical protein